MKVSLDEVDESELLVNQDAKVHFSAAKRAKESRDFKMALEEIGKALLASFEDTLDTKGIEVGRAKAEDALKLTAFGVSANDFLKLQEFLPVVEQFGADPPVVAWIQSKFGHPGNWRAETVDFCLGACLNVALNIQNAPATPHAFQFDLLYEYRITALKDQVEVWEDSVEHPASRRLRRYLSTGESIVMPANTRNFVSEDISPDRNDIIKRVRISPEDHWSAILGADDDRADFVDLADVQITCVPRDWSKERFPDLPEIPWHEDPPNFSS